MVILTSFPSSLYPSPSLLICVSPFPSLGPPKAPDMSCREHEAQREVKNEFFSQWDGLRTGGAGVTDRIMVLGATNRPQVRDSRWFWCSTFAFLGSSQ